MTEQESSKAKLSSPALFCLSKIKSDEDVKILVCSGSFRRSKEILREILLETGKNKDHSEVRFDSDTMNVKIGKSSITAMPVSDKGHLRGYRFDVVVLDNYEAIPSSVFEEIENYSKVHNSEMILFR
jgi:hypothetical protein